MEKKQNDKNKRNGKGNVLPKLLLEFVGWFAAIMILTTWLNR